MKLITKSFATLRCREADIRRGRSARTKRGLKRDLRRAFRRNFKNFVDFVD